MLQIPRYLQIVLLWLTGTEDATVLDFDGKLSHKRKKSQFQYWRIHLFHTTMDHLSIFNLRFCFYFSFIYWLFFKKTLSTFYFNSTLTSLQIF